MRHTNGTRFFTGTLAATLAFNPLGGVIQQVSANELDVMSVDDIVRENLKKSIKESFSLIDLGYIDELSKSSSGSILKNKTESGDTIKLTYSGNELDFPKGLSVGSNSEIVYDISNKLDKYDTLSFFAGLDKSESSNESVRFMVYYSNDKEEWNPLYQSGFVDAEDDALLINVNIKDVKDLKYIKLITLSKNDAVEVNALYSDIQLLSTESEKDEVVVLSEEEEADENTEEITLSENMAIEYVDESSYDSTLTTEELDEELLDEEILVEENVEENTKEALSLTVSQSSIATFSFDGNDAGKIMIDNSLVSAGEKVRYSLDKGVNWVETTDHEIQLTTEQISSITAANDIWVGLAESNEYSVIDILAGDKIDAGKLYKNDAENRFFGKTEYLQVSTDKGVTWQDYEPTMRFNGSIVVKVRYKAHGVYAMGAENQYTFSADTTSDKRKLIPVESIINHTAISQESENLKSSNMISGDGNTSWMSLAKNEGEELYYTVQFDSIKYVNEVEYLPYAMQKGRLKSGEIYASYDGQHWELIHQFSGLANDKNSKSIKFGTKVFTRYIKIVATETYEDPKISNSQNTYFSGNLFTFYEDSTVQYSDRPEIHYSTKESTTSSVTATLHLPDGYYTDVRTHKFTRNDKFNFTYRDANNQTYTLEADVNWINLLSGERGVYLSDMDYVPNLLDAWDGVKIDKNPSSSDISLLVNGEKVGFSKGLGIHAPSTIVYDVEAYKTEYPVLSVYMGVDASRNQNGTVKFIVSGSNDGLNWTPIHTTPVLRGNTDCEYLKVNISQYSYIKLYADNAGDGAGSDHSVYGDARLIRADYDINTEKLTTILKVEEYDSLIRDAHTPGAEMTQEVKNLVMKRTFVDRYGYANIQQMGQTDPTYKEAIEYIFANNDVLSLFLEAGSLEYGTGLNALKAWCKIYKAHKEDLNTEAYKKMMIGVSVALSRNTQTYMSSWGGGYRYSDPLVRYELFKQLYDGNKFKDYGQFDNLPMELVRSVVDARLGDDEIIWLREYVERRYPADQINKRFNPYNFISYIHPNYGGSDLRDPNKRTEWNAKYYIDDYGVLDYGAENMPKIWMSVEKGGICWGISGFGSSVNEVHGIPSISVYQPGHEAYAEYSVNENGEGLWNIGNAVTGWDRSYSRWAGFATTFSRLLLGWGNRSYNNDTKNNASYILLAQGALNDYENYKESMFYNFLAKSYSQDTSVQQQIYNKALDIQSINLESFEGMIESYKNDSSKTSADWLALAKRIISEYTYYPLPMVELLNLIKPYATDQIHAAELDIAKTNALIRATNATANESLQFSACKVVANSLLGNESSYLATFSFDGENAGKIVLNEKYRDYKVRVRYSLDGGTEFTENDEQVIKLSDEEIKQLSADKDLIVGLVGTKETYTIDIKEGINFGSNTYVNDEENILIGGTLTNIEYSFDGNEWNAYDGLGLKSETRFEDETGAPMVVKFRYKAHGTYLAGNTKEFTFKFNPLETDNIRYLQLQHVSLHGFSTEQTNPDNKAKNILDGNPGTIWHTRWSYHDTNKYISVKFDKVRYISKITLAPSGVNGRLKAGNIYTSMDGEKWTLVKSFSDLPNDDSLRILDLGDSYEAKYVKLVATSTYGQAGQADYFLSGKSMSFYEDISKEYKANAVIKYSTTEPTSDPVTAYLELPENCTLVGEPAYTFTKNGSYEFKFIDANGEEQSVFAEVSNIDESLPTIKYTFNTKNPTNKDVEMTITGFSKNNVKIINVEEYSIDQKIRNKSTKNKTEVPIQYKYVFNENKTLVFTLEDNLGNTNAVAVTVDWIDRVAPTAKVEYSTTSSTNKPVTVTLKDFSEEGVKVINNNGKTEYTFTKNGDFTFEIQDKAGNTTKIPVKVSWINTKGPIVNIKYSSNELTNNNVTAYIEGLKEGEFIVNNKGKASYTFTENGSFEFILRDSLGNESRAVAMVDWIDKVPPTATVKYSNTNPTTEPVKVTLSDFSEEGVTIVNNGGKAEYTFKENGIFKFILRDRAGNESEIPAVVNWIGSGETLNSFDIDYNIKTITNQDVTVTLHGLKDTDTIENNGGSKSYTFKENGEFTFIVKGENGTITRVPVFVDWIDKTAPTASIVFSNDYWTKDSVVATLVNMSEDITVINTKDNSLSYTFTDNGEFEFEFKDKAGNIGKAKAVVSWIDKSKPSKEVTFSETTSTSGNVSIKLNIDLNKIEVLNNQGSPNFVFTKNGLFTFKLRIKETGYVFEYPVLVNWIKTGSNSTQNPSTGNGSSSSSNNSSVNSGSNNNPNKNELEESNTEDSNNLNIELAGEYDSSDSEDFVAIEDLEEYYNYKNQLADKEDSSNTDNDSYKHIKKINWAVPVSFLSLSLILSAGFMTFKKNLVYKKNKDKSNDDK